MNRSDLPTAAPPATPPAPVGPAPGGYWRSVWVVLAKELVDALRDRRTLLVVLLSSVALGPLALLGLSRLVDQVESDLARDEVQLAGAAHAPGLVNYLQRQGLTVQAAPPDAAAVLQAGRAQQPLLQVPENFEADMVQGLGPRLVLVTHSGQRRVDMAARGLRRHVQGYLQEQATLRLALRGVPPGVLQVARLDEQDEAAPQQRGAQFSRMLPFFVLMAVLYGALAAALDATAGERERGSLEPLMLTATPPSALVLGKWAAVSLLGLLVALLTCLGFLLGQQGLGQGLLASLLRFGPAEAVVFLGLLAPLAGLASAVLMLVAIRCRSLKEAQASSAVVLLVASLLPMATLFGDGSSLADAPWQRMVPVLAQTSLMQQVLTGAGLATLDWAVPLAVALLGTAAALWALVRHLRTAVWR